MTEVVSKGLEYLASRPLEFMDRDPEHFGITIGALKGWFNDYEQP